MMETSGIHIATFLLWPMVQFCTGFSVTTSDPTDVTPRVNQMLVPRGSTTALLCEPLFDYVGTATWYRNGVAVAKVTGTTNAVYGNRKYAGDDSMPEVGFLILTAIRLEDEGDYYCLRDDNKDHRHQPNEISRLIVAFLDPLPNTAKIQLTPNPPVFGRPLHFNCPIPTGVPQPTIAWLFNAKPLQYADGMEYQKNGSLRLRRFRVDKAGTYECVVSNFAGRSTVRIEVNAPKYGDEDDTNDEKFDDFYNKSIRCGGFGYLRTITAWLIGFCFMLSCCYLCAMVLRPSSSRWRSRLRTIQPVPDEHRPLSRSIGAV